MNANKSTITITRERSFFYEETIKNLREQIAELEMLLNLYRASINTDITMEGPRFTGCNRSALKRAFDKDCEIAKATGGK